MKEYDRVKLIVEKEKYAKHGVHKGMIGWICDERIIENNHLVCFDDDEIFDDFPTIPVKIMDLELVSESTPVTIYAEIVTSTPELTKKNVHVGMRGIIKEPDLTDDNGWLVHFLDHDKKEFVVSISSKYLKQITFDEYNEQNK